MLAAVPRDARVLELVKLALSLLSHNQRVPDSLQDHLNKVLRQAKGLATDRKEVYPDLLPEAIDLALEIKMDARLAQELEQISSLQGINAETATRLLSAMRNVSAY